MKGEMGQAWKFVTESKTPIRLKQILLSHEQKAEGLSKRQSTIKGFTSYKTREEVSILENLKKYPCLEYLKGIQPKLTSFNSRLLH